MAYLTFTDALFQAKRRSRLTGQPFSTRDVQNLGSAYMSGAAERSAGERASALNERTLTAQEKNFADTLALNKEQFGSSLQQQRDLETSRLGQEREVSGLSLAQQKLLAERGWAEQAGLTREQLAQQSTLAGTANQTTIDIEKERIRIAKKIYDDKLIQDRLDFQAQMDAQKKGQENQLYSTVGTTGATLGGAYLLSGPSSWAPTGAGFTFGGMGASAGYGAAGGVIGGYGGAYLGRQVLGGGKQQTGSIVGGTVGGGVVGGILGGATLGAAGMSWSGPGAIVGAAVGAVVGGLGAAFGWW